ncbi:MAG TPA: M1 family aminopeptidase, partial [Terriglobia bacterium]|nr:M1 family aminopeptidase [Terriglobia bacterium]
FYNIVAVHEMAHQWWGHLVGWKTYHDQWLSEGFAEFSASLFLRQFEPQKLDSFWDLKRKWLLSNNSQGHRPVDVGPIWLGAQLPAYLESDLYQTLIYGKGAYVLEMLRAVMYNQELKNPNEPFFAMMRDFVSTYAGKNASTSNFQRIVEKHTGQRMDWFFNEWVYGTEIPHYEYKYELKNLGGGKTELALTVTQSGVSNAFQMGVPIDVFVKGQPRQIGMATLKGSETINGKIELGFRPEKVELNAENSILCTIEH